MAAQPSKASLDSMLKSILSVANSDQNMSYPPRIYQDQFNAVTSLLISKLAKSYPDDPVAIDMLDPYMSFAMIPVQSGVFKLPPDYRNILGTPYIFVNKSQDGQCGQIPVITTVQEFRTAQLKGACQATPVEIVSESEFTIRVGSSYKHPKHSRPIGYFTGQKTVKICPYDLTSVALLYVVQEPTYVYNYINQPDDTFLFNPTGSTESLWTSAAFTPIFNALCSLYAAYAKDNEMTQWTRILAQEGIL